MYFEIDCNKLVCVCIHVGNIKKNSNRAYTIFTPNFILRKSKITVNFWITWRHCCESCCSLLVWVFLPSRALPSRTSVQRHRTTPIGNNHRDVRVLCISTCNAPLTISLPTCVLTKTPKSFFKRLFIIIQPKIQT